MLPLPFDSIYGNREARIECTRMHREVNQCFDSRIELIDSDLDSIEVCRSLVAGAFRPKHLEHLQLIVENILAGGDLQG
jgi:hypothetical protein